MTEVLKESFEDRMQMRKLEVRVNAIEKKQAERYPNLIMRLDRIEQSISAIVNRLNDTERSIIRLEKEEKMDYSGAFESDIKYG